ncbi:MAG: monomethylamine:corrinoid methyltransferase [Candidatus Aminicenantes bacterium]|nr:monomethylamine:corrinoid methyltransferase [Candidatus Aminicenantes bacterium]
MGTPPYRIWEIIDRSETGPFMEEKKYINERLIPGIAKAVKKHEIKYNPSSPVNADDNMADAVWNAAVEAFLSIGIYNKSTHRVIEFTEEEIKEAFLTLPGSYIFGAGKDARPFTARTIEDKRPPFMLYSPDMTYDEADHFKACVAYLKEPLLDGICAPILENFFGGKINSHSPTELGGSLMHAMNLKEAARLVGRPGIHMVAVGTAEADSSQIHVSNEQYGIQPTDSRLVASITELETSNELMNKAVHYQQYGCYSGNLAGAIYGGYAGGAEGTAVLQTAYHLMGTLLYSSHYEQNFPFHLKYGSNTGREMLWIVSVYSQAIARNTRMPQTSNGFANAGPGTKMLYYETAAHAMASTVSGANLWEMAPARNKYHNRATPLECRLAAEIGYGTALSGMTREAANKIVNSLLEKYEKDIPEASIGKTFQEMYDVEKAVPRKEALEQYQEMVKELKNMGVPFPY